MRRRDTMVKFDRGTPYDVPRAISILLLTAVLVACSGDSGSPEDAIRDLIDRGVEAAEQRSVDDLRELVHASYRDQRGHDKKRLGGLLQGYFFRHRNIHLFTRVQRIELLGNNQAEVDLYLATAGSVISDIDAVSRLAARVFRVELELLLEDEWQVRHARWAPASLGDLE